MPGDHEITREFTHPGNGIKVIVTHTLEPHEHQRLREEATRTTHRSRPVKPLPGYEEITVKIQLPENMQQEDIVRKFASESPAYRSRGVGLGGMLASGPELHDDDGGIVSTRSQTRNRGGEYLVSEAFEKLERLGYAFPEGMVEEARAYVRTSPQSDRRRGL